MGVEILDAMARQGFEEVMAIHDRRSGLRAFLGIHDSSRGPAFGGIRRWAYRDESQGLRDCLRLARAMTLKCALADLPAGGAKIVLLDRPDLDREGAYRHLGRIVERLEGRYYTGPDVGTGPAELGWLAAETRYATPPGPEGPGELAEATTAGVFAGIAAALRHVDGAEDWPRRTVVVQGLGAVGLGLARRLLERGARVVGADVDPQRAELAAVEHGVEIVDPSTEFDQPCDVFAPCALGGILHDLTIKRLRCRIVAGGANNVLASPGHGARLHERGVLYVPDFVVNSGALIRGCLFYLRQRREPVETIGARIGGLVADLLAAASDRGRPPVLVAEEEAERRIAHARAAAEG